MKQCTQHDPPLKMSSPHVGMQGDPNPVGQEVLGQLFGVTALGTPDSSGPADTR